AYDRGHDLRDSGRAGHELTASLTSKANAFRGSLLRFGLSFRGHGATQEFAADSAPLRSELFSAEQMEQHGKSLAGSHELSQALANDRLLARLAENEYLLIRVRGILTDAVRAERRVTPAGEWLLDNFYLIEEQIRAARRHLPKGYSRELPRLRNGLSAGLPRAYDIALE